MHLASYALSLSQYHDVREVNAQTFKLEELKGVDLSFYMFQQTLKSNESFTHHGTITELSIEQDSESID